jgi:capsular polysaccharide biosynthesis protein
MELREYIQIIKKNICLFIFVVVLVLAGGLVYFCLMPTSFDASLALNIGRKGSEQTTDYKYDYYYRLGADEKFADTIVEWLKDPATVENIFEDANLPRENFSIKKLTRILKPEKRSSQLVLVYFSAANATEAGNIANSIQKEMLKNTENLNNLQKDSAWFNIISQDPVIIKHSINLKIFIPLFLVVGIFLAFWVILFYHYFKNSSE